MRFVELVGSPVTTRTRPGSAPEATPSVRIKKSNSELPEDFIFEVLLRLPIKKLTRCKTVCKTWLTLITSPSFAFRHFQIRTFRRRRMIPPFYVLCSLVNEAVFAPVSFSTARDLTRHPRINLPYIRPWMNGIYSDGVLSYEVFSVGYGIYCLFEFFTNFFLLWNPTTKQHRILPPSSYVTSFRKEHDFLFGEVGYKDGNFSYKIGRVTSELTSNSVYTLQTGGHVSVTLQLYSSVTESWKVIPDFDSGQYLKFSDRVLHCANLNGKAHWVFQSATEDTYITTFDYETELFGRIKAPSHPKIGCFYNKRRCLVTTFHDTFLCLGLFREVHGKGSYLDIWVMCKYGDEDSWTKKKNLTVGPIPDNLEVLEFSSKLKGVFLRNTTHSHTELLFWNCKSPKTKGEYSMGERRRPRRGYYLDPELQVVERVESLVPILK